MKSSLVRKTFICLLLTALAVILPQSCLYASSEDVQMLKKDEKEYLIYISNLNEEFEFAFANEANKDEAALTFVNSAVDNEENGNYIAYIDETIYDNYFEGQSNTYLWVKQGEAYVLEAVEITLEDALSESEIESINNITKQIAVEFGEMDLPEETVDGVKVTHTIGTIEITAEAGTTYSYNMVKVEENSAEANLVETLIPAINSADSEDMFTKLSIYSEFLKAYNELQPTEWEDVEDNVIQEPTTAQKGEQYLVWIKAETSDQQTIVDLQVMTCNDEYTPEYETQEVVTKTTTKMPITGENITLFVIAAILVVLIAVILVIKFRSNKKENK